MPSFTITTTITTTVEIDETGTGGADHHVDIQHQGVPENMPEHLIYGLVEAACEEIQEVVRPKGTGAFPQMHDEPDIEVDCVSVTCTKCYGSGAHAHLGECDVCNGHGTVYEGV